MRWRPLHLLVLMLFLILPDAKAGSTDRREVAFSATIQEGITATVELVYDQNNLPDYYFSRLKTPVCEDSLCYLVEIDIFWDLLGNFADYQTAPKKPLTKFDHIEFTIQDHIKLKGILANGASILKDYEVENLLDPEAKKESEVVTDAVTGATNTAIADEVVEGALYSTYTLWHIINGTLSEGILAHTEAQMQDSILQKMIRSNRSSYQYYALNHIPHNQLINYTPQFIELVGSAKELIPYFAIEKLDPTIWADPDYQYKLVTLIPKVPFPMQNEILNRLMGQPLDILTQQELIKIGRILKENQKEKISLLLENRQ